MSSLYWIRRDVRLADNPALLSLLNDKHLLPSDLENKPQAANDAPKYALFISTPQQWQQHHLAPIKADLLHRHLELFATQLAEIGIHFIHLQANDFSDQVERLVEFCQANNIQHLVANREPERNEIERDQQVIEAGLDLQLFDCDTIAPLGKILNQQGEMFKVFTPFKKAWVNYIREVGVQYRDPPQSTSTSRSSHKKASLDQSQKSVPQSEPILFDYPRVDSSHWPLIDDVQAQVIPDFLANKVADYSQQRDIPSVKGTSCLSPYLAIGALSARQLAAQLIQRDPQVLYHSEHPSFAWLNELIWRDFYKHLLHHHPRLITGECFQTKYNRLMWRNDNADFQAWCEGKTGYPIVDAAMRQLRQTGWMHNRLRMIVGSFLTKHLLIDWHWGEHFFMSQLIDGDFSANNGGWQWVASTGCDAQPYFRVFNPILQSQRFDPNGDFIRKYLPELKNVPNKQLHFPHDYLSKQGKSEQYWPPLVEHKFARQRAINFFKQS
ncbi:deoxyribodipyrimidine photo-lyase [Vibrio sp. S11_S32]|uniref:deoxyribodipyrimidine photo-lyase n=1 Tax=Vibrio sp. S11_S32 TaxID=2720225 RepID=UPI001680862C|nr:deoxyribodipyrimidine photo-lyase [Vibrio sp. S11_S32]MBD1575769.1 deoxyribodipyrimidine photo-lyase [Vibrio sp. S11_S32]